MISYYLRSRLPGSIGHYSNQNIQNPLQVVVGRTGTDSDEVAYIRFAPLHTSHYPQLAKSSYQGFEFQYGIKPSEDEI